VSATPSAIALRTLEVIAADMDEHLEVTLSSVRNLIDLAQQNRLAEASEIKESVLSMGEEMQNLISELESASSASDSREDRDILARVIENAKSVIASAFVVSVNIDRDPIKSTEGFEALESADDAGRAALAELAAAAVAVIAIPTIAPTATAGPEFVPSDSHFGVTISQLSAGQLELLSWSIPDFPPEVDEGQPFAGKAEVERLWTEYLNGTHYELRGGEIEGLVCESGFGMYIQVRSENTQLTGEPFTWEVIQSPASLRNAPSVKSTFLNDLEGIGAGRGSGDGFPLLRVKGKTHFATALNETAAGLLHGLATIFKDPKCETYLP
jgi:hypothetical protein